MNTVIQVSLLILITIAMIFAMVLQSPVIALAGLLITGGAVVWNTTPDKTLIRR